jgi:hypothetical protein
VVAQAWGRAKLYKSAFMPARFGKHVFKRKGKARLPIKELYGPSLPKEVQQNPDVYQRIVQEAIRGTKGLTFRTLAGWALKGKGK